MEEIEFCHLIHKQKGKGKTKKETKYRNIFGLEGRNGTQQYEDVDTRFKL